MRLLEIVRGAATAEDVLVTAMALAKRIKKIAVIAGVCDGFIGNRMVARYGRRRTICCSAGASPEQIDQALEKFGMAMGPFRMSDLAGHDIGCAMRKRLHGGHPGQGLLERGGSAGRGRALRPEDRRGLVPLRGRRARAVAGSASGRTFIEKFRAARGLTPRKVPDEEIVQRCVYALVNEGARILEEGIAQRSSDIDIVYLERLRVSRLPGRTDVLCRQRRAARGGARLRRIAATAGAERRFLAAGADCCKRLAAEGRTFSQLAGGAS